MNYATWKLDFTNPDYGTGPESTISDLGYAAEASGWVLGQVEDGGTILGYVTEAQDEAELASWEFTNLNEEEALTFCQSINPLAYVDIDGRISASIEA